MPSEILLNLIGVAFATTWTPGPNNVMLASSGATFGWRRTLPHAMGITFGFPFMLFLVALGLGRVFEMFPQVHTVLLWLGFTVMMWMAWRIGTARASSDGASGTSRPLSFFQSCIFQWVNPKAWAMTIAVSATFLAGAGIVEILIAVVIFIVAGLSSSQGWSAFGMAMRQFLRIGIRLRLFNGAMGAMLAVCALWLVVGTAA